MKYEEKNWGYLTPPVVRFSQRLTFGWGGHLDPKSEFEEEENLPSIAAIMHFAPKRFKGIMTKLQMG